MIYPLFKYNLKSNRLLWLSMLSVMSMYYLIILSMFDPKSVEALNAMLEMFPKALLDAMGFTQFGTSLIEYIVGYIYGFLIFLFPMVFVVSLHHKLMASPIDKGSFIHIMSTHHSRVKILSTQLLSSWVLVFGFFISTTLISSLGAIIMFPSELDLGLYLFINVYVMVLYLALSGILFMFSSILEEGSLALTLQVSVPVFFVLMKMLSGVGDKFEWLKYFTLLSLFDPNKVLHHELSVWPMMGILFLIACVFYTIAFIQFNKRNLYL